MEMQEVGGKKGPRARQDTQITGQYARYPRFYICTKMVVCAYGQESQPHAVRCATGAHMCGEFQPRYDCVGVVLTGPRTG